MDHPAVAAFVESLSRHDWVSDLWLHGSLATGDHQHRVSDVDLSVVDDRDAVHPTWTHGRLVERRLSQMVRAELLEHGREH